jgi:hypothetical protein
VTPSSTRWVNFPFDFLREPHLTSDELSVAFLAGTPATISLCRFYVWPLIGPGRFASSKTPAGCQASGTPMR